MTQNFFQVVYFTASSNTLKDEPSFLVIIIVTSTFVPWKATSSIRGSSFAAISMVSFTTELPSGSVVLLPDPCRACHHVVGCGLVSLLVRDIYGFCMSVIGLGHSVVKKKDTVINLFSALCAKLFQSGGKFFKYFFFF